MAVPTAPMMGKLVAFLGYDPTPLPHDFAGRLTVLRRRTGLTQARFARKVRADPATVSSWETGITVPPPAFWPRIIRALGADPSPQAVTLADRLLTLRRRLGLSQGELGGRLDLDQGCISDWERGRCEPRPAARAKLKRLLQRATRASAEP